MWMVYFAISPACAVPQLFLLSGIDIQPKKRTAAPLEPICSGSCFPCACRPRPEGRSIVSRLQRPKRTTRRQVYKIDQSPPLCATAEPQRMLSRVATGFDPQRSSCSLKVLNRVSLCPRAVLDATMSRSGNGCSGCVGIGIALLKVRGVRPNAQSQQTRYPHRAMLPFERFQGALSRTVPTCAAKKFAFQDLKDTPVVREKRHSKRCMVLCSPQSRIFNTGPTNCLYPERFPLLMTKFP